MKINGIPSTVAIRLLGLSYSKAIHVHRRDGGHVDKSVNGG